MNAGHRRRRSGRAYIVPLALAAGACVAATACGTRVGLDEVRAAEGSTHVVSGGGSSGAAAPAAGQASSAPAAAQAAVVPSAAAVTTAPGVATATTGPNPTTSTAVSGPTGPARASAAVSAKATAPAGVKTSAAGGPSTSSTACTSAGAPVTIGQVTTASGLIGPDVGSARPVLFAWTKWINARGGLACHPVKFVSQDDASDPGQSQSAVQDEVQNQGAQALVAGFVPLSISGFRTGIDQAKVPIIGGDLFANDWWEDPLFYPVGTYVNANAYGSTKAVASGGATKVAVLYCIEAAICPPYNTAVQAGAAKGGYQVVYSAQVTITSTDYTSQCQSAKNAGAQQISMIVDGSAVDRLARSCASINYFPKFAIASLGATFDKNGPYIRQFTATIASAASKWYAVTVPAEQDFQDAMKTYAPSLKLDPTTIVAWADAMMLKTAVDNLGPSARTQPLTTALIRKGLSMVKNETLGGLVAPTTFDPGGAPNPKDQCYFPATFGANGQWAATTPTYQCQS